MNCIHGSATELELEKLLTNALSFGIKASETIDINRNIIVYGAGNLCKMAIELLKEVGITPTLIVDRNEIRRGCRIMEIDIALPTDISPFDRQNALVVVCVVTVPYAEIANYLRELGVTNIAHFYDVTEVLGDRLNMTNGWRYRNLSEIDKTNIRKVFNSWTDLASKAHYVMVLYWRIHRQEICFNNIPVVGHDRLFPQDIIPPFTEQETLLDCGAYEGDTVKRFITMTKGNFKEIIAFEPDELNHIKLKDFVNGLDVELRNKIELNMCGVGDENGEFGFLSQRGMASRFSNEDSYKKIRMVRLDDANVSRATFVKMHLEGFEYKALTGSLQYLQKNRPILVITLYHSEEGVWKIPLFVMKNLDNYVFYHRIHAYCGNSSILYGIPTERQLP